MNENNELKKASRDFSNGVMDKQKEVTEDNIRQDTAFTEAYKRVYGYLNPDSEGLDDNQEEMANAGMQLVSDVKNPLYTIDAEDSGGLGLAGSYMKFKDAPDDVKKSMWYMWDKYEEADMTWAAFGRGMKSIGKDPSTYAGLGTGAVLKFFGKKAITHAVTSRFKNMLLGGTAGGGYTGGEEIVKQKIQGKREIDWDKVEDSSIMGAIVGTVIPPVIEGSVKAILTGSKAVGGKIAKALSLTAAPTVGQEAKAKDKNNYGKSPFIEEKETK